MNTLYRHYLDSLFPERTEAGRAFLSVVAPYLAHPAIAALSEYRHHHTTTRLAHAKSVAYLTYLACERRGLRTEEAVIAALLHDLFYFDRSHGKQPPFLLLRHPRMALENALSLFPFTKMGEGAILSHMFPLTWRMPRSREAWLLCLFDKYCSLLEFLSLLFPGMRWTSHQKKEPNT